MKVRERFWVFVFVVAGNNLQMKMNEVVSATQLSWKIEKSKTASNKLQKYAEAKNYTRPFQCKCLKTFIFCKIGRKTNLKGKKYAFQSMN